MIIKNPVTADIPALKRLWQDAFGDTETFLEKFFSTGFSPYRCRCLWKDGALAAALYWFDCGFGDKKLSYLYAVATDSAFQRQGLCAALMDDTHRHLKVLGYDGAVLVPGSEDLRRYYRRFGYENFGGIRQQRVSFSAFGDDFLTIDKNEFARLRKAYLPQGGIVQEGALLDFFDTFANFYAGDGFILAVTEDRAELLGSDPDLPPAPPEEKALILRTPGDTPFAMYLPLSDIGEKPSYFGIALN